MYIKKCKHRESPNSDTHLLLTFPSSFSIKFPRPPVPQNTIFHVCFMLECECFVQSTERANACLAEIHDTDGLPFIYMQNQAYLIDIRVPHNLKSQIFLWKSLFRHFFNCLKKLFYLYKKFESFLLLFSRGLWNPERPQQHRIHTHTKKIHKHSTINWPTSVKVKIH